MAYARDDTCVGLTLAWRLVEAADELLRLSRFGGRAWLGPGTFQQLQAELVHHRDPTLKVLPGASLTDYTLDFAICGRRIVIEMDPSIAKDVIEMGERLTPEERVQRMVTT